MKKRLEHYWLAMNAAALRAAATSARAWFAVAGAHTLSENISAMPGIAALQWGQLLSVVVFSFAWKITEYMADNPLPIDEPGEIPKPAPPTTP